MKPESKSGIQTNPERPSQQSDPVLLSALSTLNTLTAHIPGVLFQYQLNPDGSTSFPFVSTAIERMSGISKEAASNNPKLLEASVHPDDRIPLREAMLHSAATLAPWRHEYRMQLPNDETIWRALEATPERLSDGTVLWHGSTIDITERKRMEEKLRQREEPWKLALEGIGDGVWEWEVPSNRLTYSSRWKALLGYDENEISDLPEEWAARIHPDDLHLTEENRLRLLDGTTLLSSIEVRMQRRDGEWRWIHSRGIVVERDAHGHPLRIVGTNTDITERKQMEMTLRENEERWKLALDGAGQGVWDWDLLTNKGTFSRGWKMLLGFEEDEIGNEAEVWMTRIHPEDQTIFDESFRALLAGEKERDSIEFRMRCKDGQWKWMQGSGCIVSEHGKASRRMVGTLSDISERKRAEALLRTTEERWKFALEGAGDGVWDWDTRRDMLTLSSRSGEILGLSAHELTQTVDEWRRRIHPDDEANAQNYREIRKHSGSRPNTLEFRIRCNDGHYKWVLSRGMVVGRDENGTPLRMVGTLSDISPRKEAEEALRLTLIELEQRKQEAEHHAAAKTYFLNAASHDLRQPLYAAQLFLDTLMQARDILPPDYQKTLGNLSLAVNDMSSQLETLLDISRFDMGRMQPCWGNLSLSELLVDLDTTYTPAAREAGVSLHFCDTSKIAHTDAILLRRLLGNLIDNAIKFAVRGHVLVCVRRSAQGLRIEVRDNGPGISQEHRQKIFDEYFQIDNPARNPHVGLGLGLAIVQRISHLLDAPLNLRTRLGQCSVFSITLPEARLADIADALPEMP